MNKWWHMSWKVGVECIIFWRDYTHHANFLKQIFSFNFHIYKFGVDDDDDDNNVHDHITLF